MPLQNPVKQLFMTLTQGVYVVGVNDGSTYNAFTASSVMQVSMEPPMLALAVNPGNASYAMLVSSGVFTVTVLTRNQRALADHFGTHSGRDLSKLETVAWYCAPSGAPVLDAGLSYFDCQIISRHPAGDHVLVVAEVTAGDILHSHLPALRYDELGDLDGSNELLPDKLTDVEGETSSAEGASDFMPVHSSSAGKASDAS